MTWILDNCIPVSKISGIAITNAEEIVDMTLKNAIIYSLMHHKNNFPFQIIYSIPCTYTLHKMYISDNGYRFTFLQLGTRQYNCFRSNVNFDEITTL